jgi:aspartate racemase
VKTIGLLGGMSWESTATYYRVMNEAVRERIGRLHSARIVLYSFDFQEIESPLEAGDWDEAAHRLVEAGRRVEAAGADFLLIACNTMHRVADELEAGIGIPLLHIIDATADQAKRDGLATVGLLGTAHTMAAGFYGQRLEERHAITVLVPAEEDRRLVDRVIREELCLGRILDESRRAFADIIERLVARGAGGVILGCTEIPLLVGPGESSVPFYDTATIHALAAVDWALADSDE